MWAGWWVGRDTRDAMLLHMRRRAYLVGPQGEGHHLHGDALHGRELVELFLFVCVGGEGDGMHACVGK